MAYCLISWKQTWASSSCVAVDGTLWPALITLDVQFWSHRPYYSLQFCWTMLYYSMHFPWLTESCVYLMLCLPQKYLAGFFPIYKSTLNKHLLPLICARAAHTVHLCTKSCHIPCYLIKISSWELINWLFRNSACKFPIFPIIHGK